MGPAERQAVADVARWLWPRNHVSATFARALILAARRLDADPGNDRWLGDLERARSDLRGCPAEPTPLWRIRAERGLYRCSVTEQDVQATRQWLARSSSEDAAT